VTKTYDARLATRLTVGVDARLRQLALVSRRRISHVLDDVLDGALPTAEELTAQLRCLASTGQEPIWRHASAFLLAKNEEQNRSFCFDHEARPTDACAPIGWLGAGWTSAHTRTTAITADFGDQSCPAITSREPRPTDCRA
jgi:hypothetical protein